MSNEGNRRISLSFTGKKTSNKNIKIDFKKKKDLKNFSKGWKVIKLDQKNKDNS